MECLIKRKGILRTGGLEPPRENSHYHLKVARIPIPPRSLGMYDEIYDLLE